MKKMSSWYAFLRFEESIYWILGMQIRIFVKNPVFKYEFLWLFIYPCMIFLCSGPQWYNSSKSQRRRRRLLLLDVGWEWCRTRLCQSRKLFRWSWEGYPEMAPIGFQEQEKLCLRVAWPVWNTRRFWHSECSEHPINLPGGGEWDQPKSRVRTEGGRQGYWVPGWWHCYLLLKKVDLWFSGKNISIFQDWTQRLHLGSRLLIFKNPFL